jgi:hypothetical protein
LEIRKRFLPLQSQNGGEKEERGYKESESSYKNEKRS